MTGHLYSLLAGVDRGGADVVALAGCRPDVEALNRVLDDRVGVGVMSVRQLLDEHATRAAIITGFEEHLAAAGPGDVALFHFSGCGSVEPVPPQLQALETTGLMRRIVCFDDDDREAGNDLAEIELRLLAAPIAARGAHVVLVVDAGFTPSTVPPAIGAAVRVATGRGQPRPLDRFLPGLVDEMHGLGRSVARRVTTLFAAYRWQPAFEIDIKGQRRGVLSYALQNVLRTLDHDQPYAVLASELALRLPDFVQYQTVELEAETAEPVLGGLLAPRPSALVVRLVDGRWIVDAGPAHGLLATDQGWELAVLDADGSTLAGARPTASTDGRHTELALEGNSRLDPQRSYRAVVVSPPALWIELRDEHATTTDDPGPGERFPLEVRRSSGNAGTVSLVRADGSPVVTVTGFSYEQQVEHLRRWARFRSLANPWSGLRRKVRIDVVDAAADMSGTLPAGRPSLVPNSGGVIDLAYRIGPDGSVEPPAVQVTIPNLGTEPVWIAVFNLTDSFAITTLLPTTKVAAESTIALWGGQPVPITIPEHRLSSGATSIVDYLVAFVADGWFDNTMFEMARLEGAATRGTAGIERVLGGLARRALHPDGTNDWATTAGRAADQPPSLKSH